MVFILVFSPCARNYSIPCIFTSFPVNYLVYSSSTTTRSSVLVLLEVVVLVLLVLVALVGIVLECSSINTRGTCVSCL